MFNWLISPSKSLAEGMEIAFAVGLGLTTLMVVVGLAGEYSKRDRWKRYIHIFEMLVVLGVAGEMVTESGAFWYSLRLQAIEESAIVSAQQTANGSAIEAGKLGVTVDNLHNFVALKEDEADAQLKTLKAFVSAEDVRNASVIAELKNDRGALDKAAQRCRCECRKREKSSGRYDSRARCRTIGSGTNVGENYPPRSFGCTDSENRSRT